MIALLFIHAFAQNLPMGAWRTHFSYQDARLLAATSDMIFCASEFGLFSFDLQNGDTRKLSKIDGLSDTQVSALAYNEQNNLLVIGYASGFVDFVFEDQIISVPDIANTNLDTDKSINAIAFGGNRTYLATDIGIVVVNGDAEILENYVQIGSGGSAVPVEEVLYINDSLIIRTNEGIQAGSIERNLLDFTSWNLYDGSGSYQDLSIAGGQVYALNNSSILRLSANGWQDTGIDLPVGSHRLIASGGSLFTTNEISLFEFEDNAFVPVYDNPGSEVQALVSFQGDLFVADAQMGLLDIEGNSLSPDGPVSDNISNLRVVRNQLFAFHAPFPNEYTGDIEVPSYSVFREGQWTVEAIPGFFNVSDVAIFNGGYYFASVGAGLYDAEAEEIITAISNDPDAQDNIVSALAAGEKLWVASYGSDFPLHLKAADGVWNSVSANTLQGNQILSVDLAGLDVGWLGRFTGDIAAYDAAEGQVSIINTADGLPSNFLDVEIGFDDEAWVATSRGPTRFISASFIFSDSEGVRPSFEGRTLFDNQQINSILKDGGNRVWFGTENSGLWVYDGNISEQVQVFDISNSPLPSNRILQLEYNQRNGEVFILTDRGLVSYRSISSQGGVSHRDVSIFPNPVRPGFDGLVGITGLVNNATVKITDINGNLVQEVRANGASAAWDLRTMQGGSVQPGIYLFFSSSADGEETYVGKIAVIR